MDERALRAFWDASLALLEPREHAAQLAPRGDDLPYESFEVEFESADHALIKGRLSRPADRRASPLPGIITAPGYGGWEQGVELAECQRGFVVLQVYPRGQGPSPPSMPEPSTKLTADLDAPHAYYYRRAYLDMIAGLDVLAAHENVDPSRLAAVGTSQGGGLVLALAALDRRVRAVVANLPFLCDLRVAAEIPGSIAFELLNAEVRGSADLATLEFFDIVSLAPWINASVLVSSGGRDRDCPPESVRSAFDRLVGTRLLYHDPALGHGPSATFYDLSWWWLTHQLLRSGGRLEAT